MSERRGRITNYLVYLALRVVVMFIHMLGSRATYYIVRKMGGWWYRLDRRHRERAAGHLQESFPEWGADQIQCTVRGAFRNMLYLGVEVALTTRLITYWRWRRHIVLMEMPEAFRCLLNPHKGVIFIAGHFGGWEVGGYAMAALGFKGYAIARPLDNPYINEYLMGVRENMGLKILDKRGAGEQMGDILHRGEYVTFIADQDAGPRGLFVDFFGRKASSYKAPGLMAMQYEVPLVIGYSRRLSEQFRFEIGVERVIYPNEWAEAEDPLAWITQEYTTALERVVRRDPKQYLWIYRRWKTRPRGERDSPKDTTPQAVEAN